MPAVTQLTPPQLLDDGVIVHRDVMVTMRDGVRLATDVYRPAGTDGKLTGGTLPVILERTPYGKVERSRSEIEVGMDGPRTRSEVATYFVRAGYVVIFQDCRGRYNSEGEFTKYLSEGPDGFDTMEWIVAQPWCNGQIGTMGLSYAAHTQAALACLNPPGLACMVMDSGGFASAYRCGIRHGGAFELKQATWAYRSAKESLAAKSDPKVLAALEAEDIHDWFRRMPWSEGNSPVRHVPEYEEYLLDQWRRGSFDEEWKTVGIYMEGHYDSFPEVPVVLMSSWYDVYVPSTLDNYAGLARLEGRPMHLLMGPWLHGNRNTTFAGDTSFGPNATIGGNVTPSWLEFRRHWFDRWLKGITPASEEPRVRLFLMGGGSGRRTAEGLLDHGGNWISAADWPLPAARTESYYLHADGTLDTAAPIGEAGVLSYDFDPDNPVPTIGGALTSGAPIFEGGGFDQREEARFFGSTNIGHDLAERPDVLSFVTEPLAEDMAVIGPISVDLWVSSDAPDTDFTAKLVDVYPPSEDYPEGFALILSDGIFRCRYRNSWEKPELIGSTEPFRITIEPFATANLFKAGHRLRLDISSSNFPKFDVNPNSGEPEGYAAHKRVAHNSVFCTGTRASSLQLPVVPVCALTPLGKA